ncbi:MAG: phosphotransferase enzyme family protein, partial [Gemmatimonadetes bacterium]|nr:phosphotransferase enzyme family protein [Gemmatimonadota bacterium]
SLLYDAKANVPSTIRDRLLDHYLEALRNHVTVDEDLFREHFKGFVLIRLMQAMGAFGYRGFFERKRRFLESVPFAAKNLKGLLESGLPLELPELEAVFGRIVGRWAGPGSDSVSPSSLTVGIQSFSFKKGPPETPGGHGGGSVFDCRGLPNPGRIPELAEFTGRDEPVANFLETTPEVQEFWESCRGIVDLHVRSFLDRDFSDLSVAFGCTGGQHRSVFMAEKMAEHLRAHFPNIQVRLNHREL